MSKNNEPETLSNQAKRLLDWVEQKFCEWIQRLRDLLIGKSDESADEMHCNSKKLDLELEKVYDDLQSSLIKVREAVAKAIATERQLESQLQKNRAQSETWLQRAETATQQGNPDLHNQAIHRMNQYKQAAHELEQQLVLHKEAITVLRQKLTDLESNVQKAYTQKQVLISRKAAAQTAINANRIMDAINTDAAFSAFKSFEQEVIELEAQAAKGSASVSEGVFDYRKSLKEAIENLQQTTEAVVKLEKMLSERDSDTSL